MSARRSAGFAAATAATVVAAAAGVVVTLAAEQSSSHAAVKPQTLRTLSVTQSGNSVSAVVVMPALLSRRTVPQSAFRVSEDGAFLVPRVLQLPVTEAELTVVIDAPEATASTLATIQGAVADFIVHLPAQLPVAVAPAGSAASPVPVVERVAALAALRDLKAQPQQQMGSALADVLAGVVARDDDRSVVLVVSSRSRDLGGDVPAFTPGRPLVYAAVAPAAARSAVVPLVRQSIGTVTQWTTGEELLRSLDAVSGDIAGQYRLEFESASLGTPIEVTTDYAGVQAAGSLGVPAESEASPSAAPSSAASPGVGTETPSQGTQIPSGASTGASAVPSSIGGTAAPTAADRALADSALADSALADPALADPAGEGAGGAEGTNLVLAMVLVVVWFAAVGVVALVRSRRAGVIAAGAVELWAPERVDPGKRTASNVDSDLDAEHSALIRNPVIRSHSVVGGEWAPERARSTAADTDPDEAAEPDAEPDGGIDAEPNAEPDAEPNAEPEDRDGDGDANPERTGAEGTDEDWAPETIDLPAGPPAEIDLTAAADSAADHVNPRRH